MTIKQIKSKFRRKAEQIQEEAEEEGGEINLVPFMDIIINVIMFLLATLTVVLPFGNVNVASPQKAAPGSTVQQAEPDEPDKPKLNLSVTVSDTGFIVATLEGVQYQDGVPGKLPTIPKKGAEYDWPTLAAKAAALKKEHGHENQVILGANPDIPYALIVKAMDTLREMPGKTCTQSCKDENTTPQACRPDRLTYSGDCLFPEVALSIGVE